MSPWRRGGDVAGRGAWASRPRSAILTREAAAGRGEALRGEAGCGGEGVPTGAGRDGATRAPGAAARSRGALPRAPQHEDPGGHRWGRGQHVWGRLVAPGNREEKLWAGAEGVQGSPIDPQFWGDPPSTRNLLLLAARAKVLPGSPNFVDPLGMVWVLRVLVFPARTRQPGLSRDLWGGRVPPSRSVTLHSGGRDVCGARGEGSILGPAMLGSALRGPAGDLHGGACPAPGERVTGWPRAGRKWGARDSGSELHRPSPVRLLAPPPALSRKVPKRSPNVRKRNFLFPTLERAALRWLRGDLGTLLRRGRRPGVEEGGKDGGECRGSLIVLPPPRSCASLSAGRLFPPPLFPAKLLLLKGPGFPSPPPIAGRGAAGLTPLPLGLFPLPLPRRPRACTGWTLRGGRGPRRPLPVCPVGIRPGAGTREGGKGAGRRCSNLFPSPGGGRGSGSYVRVCAPTGPPTPPPCSAGGGGS